METKVKILLCQKISSQQLMSKLKQIILTDTIQKIVLIQKKHHSQNPNIYKNCVSLPPPNQYRHEMMNTRIQILTREIIEKVNQYAECQAAPFDFVGKLQLLYQEQKYQQIINSVQNSNVELSYQPNISFILGNCMFRLKQYDQAIKYYQIRHQGQNQKQSAQRMNNLGTCLAQIQQYQLSLKAYTQSLKYYKQLPEMDSSNLLYNIGQLYKKSQMYKQSEDYFTASIKQRQLKSPYNQMMLYKAYIQLGIAKKQQSNYQQSLNTLMIALNYSKQNHSIDKTRVLRQLCLVYEKMQKWGETLNYYQDLSEEYQRKNMNQGYIYQKVAYVHNQQKNYMLSMKFLKRSLVEYRKDGNQRKMSDISSSLIAAEEYSKIQMQRQKYFD